MLPALFCCRGPSLPCIMIRTRVLVIFAPREDFKGVYLNTNWLQVVQTRLVITTHHVWRYCCLIFEPHEYFAVSQIHYSPYFYPAAGVAQTEKVTVPKYGCKWGERHDSCEWWSHITMQYIYRDTTVIIKCNILPFLWVGVLRPGILLPPKLISALRTFPS